MKDSEELLQHVLTDGNEDYSRESLQLLLEQCRRKEKTVKEKILIDVLSENAESQDSLKEILKLSAAKKRRILVFKLTALAAVIALGFLIFGNLSEDHVKSEDIAELVPEEKPPGRLKEYQSVKISDAEIRQALEQSSVTLKSVPSLEIEPGEINQISLREQPAVEILEEDAVIKYVVLSLPKSDFQVSFDQLVKMSKELSYIIVEYKGSKKIIPLN